MTHAPPYRKAHRKYLWVFIVLLFVVAALWYFLRPNPVPVSLTTAERGTVEATISNTRAGTVKACRRAKLAAPAGGQISRLLVHKGQRVMRGQILLELWNDDLRAQQQLALQQLDTARTQAHQACLQADLAEKEADRSRQLRDSGFISAEGLDQRNSAAKVSRAGCEAAQSQVAQSKSRVAVAEASLQRLILRAPFAGVVADISGELGEYATPSPPGILTLPAIDLLDDSCLYVSAPIDEVDAAKLKIGQPSRISLDAIKGQTFAGKVRRIAPYVLDLEKQARTVEVEVEFVDTTKEQNLLVGYSADVEIIYDIRKDALRIPMQTLLDGNRVLLFDSDDMLESRPVKIGLSNWEYAEVTDGLAQGDRIVSSQDRTGLKAGVRAIPESSRPAQ